MKYFWLALGWMSIALGIAGAVLPLLPTTPFLLLAAFAFSKGSQRMHQWLITHPRLGPPIVDWREHRVITRPTKVIASISMLTIVVLSLALRVPYWAIVVQCGVLTIVAIFLWRQREVR